MDELYIIYYVNMSNMNDIHTHTQIDDKVFSCCNPEIRISKHRSLLPGLQQETLIVRGDATGLIAKCHCSLGLNDFSRSLYHMPISGLILLSLCSYTRVKLRHVQDHERKFVLPACYEETLRKKKKKKKRR